MRGGRELGEGRRGGREGGGGVLCVREEEQREKGGRVGGRVAVERWFSLFQVH